MCGKLFTSDALREQARYIDLIADLCVTLGTPYFMSRVSFELPRNLPFYHRLQAVL